MATSTTRTNKPILPRGNDQSPKGYNRAALYSGKALDFDGVNDYIDLAGFTLSGSVASFSFYVNADGTGNVYFLDANPNRFVLRFSNNNVALFSGSLVEFGAINTNEWTHLVYVLNGTSAKCYANGVQLGTEQTITAIDLSAATDFDLGRWYLGGAFYDGGMANFKTFNTALTAAQVSDLYNNPEKIVPTGVEDTALKLWLPMMEGAGTTAYDGSGNGNHGTISGATYVNGVGSPVAQSAVIDWNKGTNLQPYSEQLDNSAWTQQAASITANVIASPDGYQNADELVVNTSTAFHQLAAVQSVSAGTTYAFSVYAKQGSGTKYFQIAGAGLQAASQAPVFDLQNGVVYTAVTKTVCLSADIESVGDGWYRCSLIVAATGSAGMTLCFVGATNAFSGDSFAGNGTDSFYFWGTQVEAADSLGAYIPNHTSTQITTPVLLPQGLTTGRDITGVNLFENVRKQGALNLDGNSWAEVHDNASLDVTTGVSVECWFYKDDQTTQSGLLGKWGPTTGVDRCYMLMIGADNKVRFYTNTDAGIDPSALSNGWNHIVGTYDKTTQIRKLYVNAIEKDSDAFSSDLITSDKPVEIGRYNYTTTYQLPNQIAQPRIYNRALTAEEVQRNYDAGKNIYK